jgi:hypothetical protein
MSNLLHWPVDPNRGLRGIDDFGSGAFGADRETSIHSAGTAPAGTQYGHMGLDLAADPDSFLIAPCDGLLTTFGWAYKNEAGGLRTVHLLADRASVWNGYRFVIMYADATERLKLPEVKAGDVIGVVQNVSAFHSVPPQEMKNHIHFAAYKINAKRNSWDLIDPAPLLMKAA